MNYVLWNTNQIFLTCSSVCPSVSNYGINWSTESSNLKSIAGKKSDFGLQTNSL